MKVCDKFGQDYDEKYYSVCPNCAMDFSWVKPASEETKEKMRKLRMQPPPSLETVRQQMDAVAILSKNIPR